MKKSKSCKGQSWTIEFILAFLIFSSAIILSIKMISNIYKSTDFDDVMKESEILSNALLSEGYPQNWSSSDVIRPGILTDGRINMSKLANLTGMDYYASRQLFGMNYDFFLYFSDDQGVKDIFADFGMPEGCGYGNPGVAIEYNYTCRFEIDLKYENLVTLSRLVVYNNSILTMTLYVWD